MPGKKVGYVFLRCMPSEKPTTFNHFQILCFLKIIIQKFTERIQRAIAFMVLFTGFFGPGMCGYRR